MNNRRFSTVSYEGRMVRVVYDEFDLITHICLDDICTILHRERMIGTDELQRTCPSMIQLGEPSKFQNLPWYVTPFDITRLTRKLSKEGKIITMTCESIENWLAALPWGKANKPSEENTDRFDAVGVTKSTLQMEFQSHTIVFRIMSNRMYVNATQMAHIYDQLPSSWLRKVDVVKWMDELVEKREFPDLNTQVMTVKGKYGGTWIEEKLGIEFTKFLSDDIHRWYMGALKTLLPNKYDIPQKSTRSSTTPKKIVMPTTLEQAHVLILELQEKIDADRPKVEFYTDYVDDREWFKSMRLADELEISPYRLHQFLMEQGICSYEKRQWVVRSQYQALQAEIPYLWTNPQGKTYAFGKIRRWTQAGREYILELYRKTLT